MAAGAPSVQSALIDAHETLPAESLGQAFVAARRSRKPAEVFALFSPYLTAGVNEKKKNRDPAWAKREAIIRAVDARAGGGRIPMRRNPRSPPTSTHGGWTWRYGSAGLTWSRRLAVPGHAGANEFLAKLFRQGLGKAGKEYELSRDPRHHDSGRPSRGDRRRHRTDQEVRAGEIYVRVLRVSYWVGHLIPRLPKAEALPKLEALLPTLPEKMIDQLLDYVTELKQGTPTATST